MTHGRSAVPSLPPLLAPPPLLAGLTAAYTGWLGLGRLEAPPPGFNLASGWIWMPRTTEGASAAVIDPDGV